MGGSVGSRASAPARPRSSRFVPAPSVAIAAVLGLLAAAVPCAVHLAGGSQAVVTETGLLASGGVALVAATAALVHWGRARRRGPMPVWRAIFALAVAAWGLGQISLWSDAVRGVLAYPATGDSISALAAPLGVIAIIAVPRASSSSWPGLRLGLDSIVLGLAAGFAVRAALRSTPLGPTITEQFGTVVFVVADTAVLSMAVLMAIRDVRSRIVPAVVGVFCHVAADLLALHASADGLRELPWVSASLWCVCWPLVAVGVMRYRPRPAADVADAEQDRAEATVTAFSSVLSSVLVISTLLVVGFPVRDSAGFWLLVGALAAFASRDIAGSALLGRLAADLRAEAFRDPLTGLANRRALISRIQQLDLQPARADADWVVLTVDLDGFTQINDLLGHAAGDGLLIGVGEAVERNRPAGGVAARLGGDEFAVLAPGGLEDGARLGERLRKDVDAALERLARGLGTSVSVGVGRLVLEPAEPGAVDEPVVAGDGGDDRLAALVESAAALKAAKRAGGDRVAVYADEIAAEREHRLTLERRLRRAVAARAITTHAQPLVDLGTGELRKFEALARWTDDELGPVRPDEFIAVAEETGLIVALGEQLLDATLGDATRAGVFAAGYAVAINVSPIQLRAPGFADAFAQLVLKHRVPQKLLVVEVTEAILVTDDDPALRTLEQLAAFGVDIAIDDFGTGYSALGYLRRLPVQVLKVDRSLTRGLAEPTTLAIVEGVVRMAHRMGVQVVMEGVEDEAVAEACRAVAADLGQGWLYGRPTPWPDAARLVTQAQTQTPTTTQAPTTTTQPTPTTTQATPTTKIPKSIM